MRKSETKEGLELCPLRHRFPTWGVLMGRPWDQAKEEKLGPHPREERAHQATLPTVEKF